MAGGVISHLQLCTLHVRSDRATSTQNSPRRPLSRCQQLHGLALGDLGHNEDETIRAWQKSQELAEDESPAAHSSVTDAAELTGRQQRRGL